MPPHIQPLWTMVNPMLHSPTDGEVAPLVDWLLEEGPRHGARFPTTAERGRAMDMADYLQRLNLSL
eukprot:5223356-Prorocentrum_lima.AAC.1